MDPGLVIKALAGLLPVCLFLWSLVYLDTYKLVKFRTVAGMVGVGILTAVTSYLINDAVDSHFGISRFVLSRSVAPVVEETLKALPIVVLIRLRRVGFLVDGAVLGFAVGTGFALYENVFYLRALPEAAVALWLIRGFGTAIMHSGATAIFAIVGKSLTQTRDRPGWRWFVPGLVLATLIHAAFNHLLFSPLLATLGVLVVLPILLMFFFTRSERRLQAWLGSGFDLDNELLRLIQSQEFSSSPIGLYLKSLRQHFPGEVVADMLCYLRLHTELALRAKGVLMMREQEFSARPDPEVRSKLEELRYLERAIGRTGMASLMPIVRSSATDVWQLEILEET